MSWPPIMIATLYYDMIATLFYDHVRVLVDGRVCVEGCAVSYLTMP